MIGQPGLFLVLTIFHNFFFIVLASFESRDSNRRVKSFEKQSFKTCFESIKSGDRSKEILSAIIGKPRRVRVRLENRFKGPAGLGDGKEVG